MDFLNGQVAFVKFRKILTRPAGSPAFFPNGENAAAAKPQAIFTGYSTLSTWLSTGFGAKKPLSTGFSPLFHLLHRRWEFFIHRLRSVNVVFPSQCAANCDADVISSGKPSVQLCVLRAFPSISHPILRQLCVKIVSKTGRVITEVFHVYPF